MYLHLPVQKGSGMANGTKPTGTRPQWRSSPAFIMAAFVATALTGCGGTVDSGDGQGASGSDGPVRIVVNSGATPGDVVAVSAAIENGADFGLKGRTDDIKRFDSHSTATQVLLSGRGDVISGSLASTLKLIEQGQDIKVFCPIQNATEEVLVGTGDVRTVEDLKDPKNRLAVDSPGGGADFFLNFLLNVEDAGFTVKDIPSKIILEDGDQRLSAMQNGEAAASILAFQEVEFLKQARGADDVHEIKILAEALGDQSIYVAWGAQSSWLAQNKDLAARFCASALDAHRKIGQDFNSYKTIADKYIVPPVPEKDLKQLWDLNDEYTVWATDPMISEEQLKANIKVVAESGLLNGELAYEDVVDTEVMEAAAEILQKKGSNQ